MAFSLSHFGSRLNAALAPPRLTTYPLLFVSSAHKYRHLPLTALRAFDAVMRLGSMTRAADELGVTHGAISRQINTLQDDLGYRLFDGPRNARRPTPKAARLWAEVGPAFERLAIAVSASTDLDRRVQVSCLSTLAGRWLIPRLARWPHGWEIEITESYADLDRSLGGAEVAIRMLDAGAEPPAGLVAVPFMVNHYGPVAAPGVDAAAARRLISRSHPQAIDDWNARTALRIGSGAPPMLFDHQQTMIEACLAGLGVCVTQQALIEPELASARLLSPFGFETDGAVFAAFHREGTPRAETRRFLAWLQTRAAQST